jgi:serine kinase of HPr protein (carbohydrate metabolism regulator)
MVLDWFDAKAIVAFPGEIAQELGELRGAGSWSTKVACDNKGQVDQKKLVALIVRVQAFAKKQAFNRCKKAKFLNTVKWRLKDSGEDAAFIGEIVRLRTATFYA